ncbi:MAG: FHA domain-containing protein [Gammaproteobacteria bacterium]|nr:FHA domain-containing protein [Gammaproteobacteria bacterium]
MEPLILEVKTRGLHRYFELNRDITRIGRALDNDIILSDPTVSPYHLKISRNESGSIKLENLAEINPTKINNCQQDQLESSLLPLNLQLGRIKATILSRSQSVAGTRQLAGNHGQNLLQHPICVYLLAVICLLVGGLHYFLGNFSSLRWDALFSYMLRETALSIGLFVLALTVIERLLVNRWEVKSVTICVCLAFLGYAVASLLAYQIAYLLSSQWPLTLFNLGWQLFIIPTAIGLYLIKFSHVRNIYSICLAIIICSPYSVPALLNNPIAENLSADFNKAARYHSSLSAINWHLSKTVSINEFIKLTESLESGRFVD